MTFTACVDVSKAAGYLPPSLTQGLRAPVRKVLDPLLQTRVHPWLHWSLRVKGTGEQRGGDTELLWRPCSWALGALLGPGLLAYLAPPSGLQTSDRCTSFMGTLASMFPVKTFQVVEVLYACILQPRE
jgi:hypothetical protein